MRSNWGQAFRDVAIRLAREAERAIGAGDASPCAGCEHPRSTHCGCGTACLTLDEAGARSCKCSGFEIETELSQR